MHVTTFGVQSGSPTRESGVSGTAVRFPNQPSWYLVDCGDGTLEHIVHSDYNLAHLKAICITHCHADHLFGLPAIVMAMSNMGRKDALTIIGPPEAYDFITSAIDVTGDALSYHLLFTPVSDEWGLVLGDVTISAVKLSHRIACHGYLFKYDHRVSKVNRQRLEGEGYPPSPLYGHLQSGHDVVAPDGRLLKHEDYRYVWATRESVLVCGDNDDPELLRSVCKDIQLLVHEATFLDVDKETLAVRTGHSTARSIAEFAQRMGVPRLLLTHFSPRYNPSKIETEARAYYKGDLVMARPGHTVEVRNIELISGEHDEC